MKKDNSKTVLSTGKKRTKKIKTTENVISNESESTLYDSIVNIDVKTVIGSPFGVQLSADTLNMNLERFTQVEVMGDYTAQSLTNVVEITKPEYVVFNNKYYYENWILGGDCVDYLTRLLANESSENLSKLLSWFENRQDEVAMIFRRLFLAGNGHFKTKAMKVTYSMIDSTICHCINNGISVDKDLSAYCFDDSINVKICEPKLLVNMFFILMVKNNLVNNSNAIVTIHENGRDRIQARTTILEELLRSRLKTIVGNLKWPKLDNGEFFITSAADAFTSTIRTLMHEIQTILVYKRAYTDILPLVKLVLLKKHFQLGPDIQDIIESPNFKILTVISNVQQDALNYTSAETIKPSYVLSSAVQLIYDGIMNNNDLKVYTTNEFIRLFTLRRYTTQVDKKLKVVQLSFFEDVKFINKNFLVQKFGKLSKLTPFREFDDFNEAGQRLVARIENEEGLLLKQYCSRYLHRDSKKLLCLFNVNDELLHHYAIAISDKLYVAKDEDSNSLSLTYRRILTDQQVNEDDSLRIFGKDMVTNSINDLVYYAGLEHEAKDKFQPRNMLYIDDKHLLLGKDVDTYTKKLVFKTNNLEIRLLDPERYGEFLKFNVSFALAEVLLPAEMIYSLVQHTYASNVQYIKDVLLMRSDLKAISSLISIQPDTNGHNFEDYTSEFILRYMASREHKLVNELFASTQLKAVEQFVWLKSVTHINNLIKQGDESVKTYTQYVGSVSNYDVKLKQSIKYAVGLWYLKYIGLLDDIEVSNIYSRLCWYMEDPQNISY